MNQSELEANTCNRRQTREIASDKNRIGFGCTSNSLRKCREFDEPITEGKQKKVKAKKNTFHMHSVENRSTM